MRVELVRQLRRRRTLVAFGLAIALPLIVVAAVKLGPQSRGFGDGDLDSVARDANSTVYGLSGSVWTRDLSTAHRLVSRIRAGHVSINCHGAVGTNIPFGGFDQSGWGREFGQDGLDSYLETKAVTARLAVSRRTLRESATVASSVCGRSSL